MLSKYLYPRCCPNICIRDVVQISVTVWSPSLLFNNFGYVFVKDTRTSRWHYQQCNGNYSSFWHVIWLNFLSFLAVLDYVSRAHKTEISPSSVVRPSVAQLSLNLMHGFLSNFGCWFCWAICSGVFAIFENFFFFWIFYESFSFSLTWDPMEAKISKRYSSYNSQPNAFKLFLNFLPYGPHKTTFRIFEILKIWNFNQFFFENFKFTIVKPKNLNYQEN